MLKLSKRWDWVWFGDKSFKGCDLFASGRGAACWFSAKSPILVSTFFIKKYTTKNSLINKNIVKFNRAVIGKSGCISSTGFDAVLEVLSSKKSGLRWKSPSLFFFIFLIFLQNKKGY